MYDEHLKTFLTVADAGSFRKAGDILYVTPSALIKQISLLEEDIGVPLFIRSPKGLTLTEAGKYLYSKAKDYMEEGEKIKAETRRRAATASHSPIRIASSLMNQPSDLLSLWKKVSAAYPEIKITLVPYEDTGLSFENLLQSFGKNIDIVCSTGDILTWKGNFRLIGLGRVDAEITCSSLNPLAMKESLTYQDLARQRILVIKKGNWPEMDEIREDLEKRNLAITFIEKTHYEFQDYNDLASTMDLLIGPQKWASLHPLLVSKKVNWNHTFITSLLVSENPRDDVKTFLKAIEKAKKEQE